MPRNYVYDLPKRHNNAISCTRSTSSSSRVHITTSANFDSTTRSMSFASQNTRKIVLIHKITLSSLLTLFVRHCTHIFLLILGENKAISPTSLSTAALPFAIGRSVCWFRNAEYVAAIVPLHVLLEVEFELTVGVGRA